MAEYRAAVDPVAVTELATELGLRVQSLERLRIGWCGWGWTFPMSDVDGSVRGIRVRKRDGTKLAIKGSNDGLFIPTDLDAHRSLLICEGPTDTAALLDLGFNAVGRPSCSGGTRLIVDGLKRWGPSETVILADYDEPGQLGANALASVLVAYCPAVRLITPPDGINDARQWLRSGATHEAVQQVIDAAPVRRLRVHREQAYRSVEVSEHG